MIFIFGSCNVGILITYIYNFVTYTWLFIKPQCYIYLFLLNITPILFFFAGKKTHEKKCKRRIFLYIFPDFSTRVFLSLFATAEEKISIL